jgi:hypothetical protein
MQLASHHQRKALPMIQTKSGEVRSVYIYDNAHGVPERHRVHHGVKLAGERLPTKGSARLDLPAMIGEIKANWRRMVERWEP